MLALRALGAAQPCASERLHIIAWGMSVPGDTLSGIPWLQRAPCNALTKVYLPGGSKEQPANSLHTAACIPWQRSHGGRAQCPQELILLFPRNKTVTSCSCSTQLRICSTVMLISRKEVNKVCQLKWEISSVGCKSSGFPLLACVGCQAVTSVWNGHIAVHSAFVVAIMEVSAYLSPYGVCVK